MPSLRGLVPALAAAAVLAPVASAATVVRALDLDRLAHAAARVVVTEVVDVRVEQGPGRGQAPVTLVTLRVVETIKGAPALQLVLEFAGGRIEGRGLEIVGMPAFTVGDRDVLFLHDAPGMLSPVVGVFAGRFRVHGSTVVPASRRAGLPVGDPIPLGAFTRTVRELVAVRRGGQVPAPTEREDAATWLPAGSSGVPLPDCLRVDLGPAPALADGCRDWTCAVARAVDLARPRLAGGLPAPRVVSGGCPPPAGAATIAWATSIHGRALDAQTLALVVREQDRVDAPEETRTSILLNGSTAWNARDGGLPVEGDRSLDLVGVLAETLVALAEGSAALAAERSTPAAGDETVDARAAREPPARVSPRVAAAADPCAGGAGAMVNPRLLIFDSVDHARMTAYQVGFFLPRAAAPVTIVNMPFAAFLERRVIDLPESELAAMQRTQVASISSAGLATPLGRVYTYRVRGVWSGGTTAWSAPSPAFVRCPQ